MSLHPPVWADCVSQKLWVYVWGSSQLWPAKSPCVRCSQLWGKPCWRVGMRCTENPSWGADSYLVLFFIASWARSLYCHLCSSQAVPSVLGNRVSVTGYTRWKVHRGRAYLWGTVFREWRSPLLPPALTAPRRRGSCQAMVASCIASQSPWSPGSQGDFVWLSFAPAWWRAPAEAAAWLQALPGAGGVVGAEGRGRVGGLSLGWWALGPAPSWWRGELDCGEERRRSLHPSQGWREVIRQVQCGGLSCRPAVSCGFHGN